MTPTEHLVFEGKKKNKLSACRGEGSVVGLLLAARALPLRCAASAVLSSALLTGVRIQAPLTHHPIGYWVRAPLSDWDTSRVIRGSGSTCVSVLSVLSEGGGSKPKPGRGNTKALCLPKKKTQQLVPWIQSEFWLWILAGGVRSWLVKGGLSAKEKGGVAAKWLPR
jgi:hypothetical protein